ncbi:hypothetical protein SAMN05192569_10796 [Parageobacillus thermantarcticus]|uniref:Uncharacterized protein n=1 Tax=Parageobacillus thermantarcticus TaxID=186116 RepID=A0A1I0TXS6_9BACL|nr:hypothetical protein [Parageobacillus thermantarcticus]SFA56749.1 hypothetical protein SAMN05192569_10796 [Parageobacillus thermantarcticus]
MILSKRTKNLSVLFVAVFLFFSLITISVKSFTYAKEKDLTLNGQVTFGISLDDAPKDLIDNMKQDGVHFIGKYKKEGIALNPQGLTININDSNGNTVSTLHPDVNGLFESPQLDLGKYEINVLYGEKTIYTDKVKVGNKKTYQFKALIPLKNFLDEMHPAIDENDNHNDNSMDNTGTITILSHKSPHIPCNDYNGVDSDGRHVHDWTHFKGSDCYWVFAVWMRTPQCALDKWDSTEYCDGTRNCSPAMGHPTKFHWHDNFEGTKWHY